MFDCDLLPICCRLIGFSCKNEWHFKLLNWGCGWGVGYTKQTTVLYPKKYAHGFVVLCFFVVMQSFIMNSHEVFIHIHQGCFAGTGAIVRLPQCQWSKPDGYGKISQCITTTKHSKAKTVCIFLGIYCTTVPLFTQFFKIIETLVTYHDHMWWYPSKIWVSQTLKRKCCHFDEIFITDCTGRCSQWWKFLQNDNICVSVKNLMGSITKSELSLTEKSVDGSFENTALVGFRVDKGDDN